MRSRTDYPNVLQSLRRLPRQRPSDDFTETLLARLESRSRWTLPTMPQSLWLAGSVLLLTVGLWGASEWLELQRQRVAHEQRVQTIRNRYWQMRQEVDDLRRYAANSPAVVYLAGGETYDLVVDLADLAPYETTTQSSRNLPANHQP